MLSVVTQGFLEIILTSGIPLNVGSAYTLSSQPPITFLGSSDTFMRRFFSALFYHSQINGGFPCIPRPTLTYTTLIGQYCIENACSRILILFSGYTLKSLRELGFFFSICLFVFNMSISEPYPEIQV